MKCPSCGSFVQDGAMFCTSCGAQTAPGPNGEWGAPPPPPVDPSMPQPQPQRTPWTGGSKDTTIIAAVIIVVAVIALSAFMWIYIDESEILPPDEKLVLNLASPSVMTRDIANITHWDTVININKVTPKDASLLWIDVEVIVKNADGSVLLPRTRSFPDDPGNYDDAANGWVDVEVWAIDIDQNGLVSPGDAIKITGMDIRFEGGFVEIVQTSPVERIGGIVLPTQFP